MSANKNRNAQTETYVPFSNWLGYAVLIMAASFAVTFNSLDNGFLFDDRAAIVENKKVTKADFSGIWSEPSWFPFEGDRGWRPLTTSSMYAGIIWLICVGEIIGKKDDYKHFSVIFLLPAVLLLPQAFSSLDGAGHGVTKLSSLPTWLMFESYSFFHIILLGFCAASLYGFGGVLKSYRQEKNADFASLFSGSISLILGTLLLWPISSGIMNVLFKSSPWVKYIAEYRPLFMPYPDPQFKPTFAFQMCSYLLPLYPFAWYAVARRAKDTFLWSWPLLLFGLVMLQLRYIYLFAYPLALLMAVCGAWFLESKFDWSKTQKRLILAAVALFAFWPSLHWLGTLAKGSRYRYLTISDQDYEMLTALRVKSAKTSGFDLADKKPDYGVLAPWSLGHSIIYIGERPVVADPFGHGIDKSAKYYTAESTQEALQVIKENKVGYVVGQDMSGEMTQRIYGEYLNLPPEHAMMKGEWSQLFHMRILTDMDILDAPAETDVPNHRQGHRLVHRSENGYANLYQIKFPEDKASETSTAKPDTKPIAKPDNKPKTKTTTIAKTPKPVTPSPKPVMPSPKPATPSPKPMTPSLKPVTPGPEPTAKASVPTARSPKPKAPNTPADYPDNFPEIPSPFASQASTESMLGGIVARLGDNGVVSEQDLKDFKDSNGCRGEGALNSRKAGFMQMLETALQQEFLWRDSAQKLKLEELEKERKRIDTGTRAPDILLCMKQVFSFNKDQNKFTSGERYNQYLRVFVRPILINKKGHYYFSFDKKLQKDAYTARDNIKKLIEKKKTFEKIGKQLDIKYSSQTYSYEKKDDPEWSPFQKIFIDEHLKKVSPGEVLPEPIEGDQEIRFVRLLSVEGELYEFETLWIKKLSIRQLTKIVKKLPTTIYDSGLKAWIESIHGNPLLWALELK